MTIDTKPDGLKIFFDIDNQILYFSNEYNNAFENLESLINELSKYVLLYRGTDFNKNVNKLKFKQEHKIEIFKIFDKYRDLFNINNIKSAFMIYGYWFSEIVCKYFNLYFNEKIEEKYAYFNSVAFGHRKCEKCESIDYIQINSRMDLDSLINYGKNTYVIFNKDIKYICKKCNYLMKIEIINMHDKNDSKYISALCSIPYKEYLETDHWKEIRERMLKLYDYKCQICGSTYNLNVHHNTYENRGCEKDEDLVVLCNKCHNNIHKIKNHNE